MNTGPMTREKSTVNRFLLGTKENINNTRAIARTARKLCWSKHPVLPATPSSASVFILIILITVRHGGPYLSYHHLRD